MARCRVSVQLRPEHTSMADLRRAWRAADALGVDGLFTWDHFFPLSGPPDGGHFEAWTTLAAMAVETSRASVGLLVTAAAYRNPDLVADMARTVDHLSGGRAVLGIGAGWFARDHAEYGYDLGTPGERARRLGDALARIRARLAVLRPPPLGPLPILVGGGGERVTLRLAAIHADMWNGIGPPERIARKQVVLDRWCAEVGRDPAAIERSVALRDPADVDLLEAYLEVGVQHVILGVGSPFDLAPVERLLELAG